MTTEKPLKEKIIECYGYDRIDVFRKKDVADAVRKLKEEIDKIIDKERLAGDSRSVWIICALVDVKEVINSIFGDFDNSQESSRACNVLANEVSELSSHLDNQQSEVFSVQDGEVGDTIKDKETHKSFLSSPADNSNLCENCGHKEYMHQGNNTECCAVLKDRRWCPCKKFTPKKEVKPIILDDNPLSIACYMEEHPEVSFDSQQKSPNEIRNKGSGKFLSDTQICENCGKTKEEHFGILKFCSKLHKGQDNYGWKEFTPKKEVVGCGKYSNIKGIEGKDKFEEKFSHCGDKDEFGKIWLCPSCEKLKTKEVR